MTAWVSLININIDIKEPPPGYQNCNTCQILIFGSVSRCENLLYTRVIIWVNTIQNHIDTRMIFSRYEGSCMVYRLEWYRKPKCHQIPIPYWYLEMVDPHSRYPNGIKRYPDQHWYTHT